MLRRNTCLIEIQPGVFYCKNRHIYHHNPPETLICCSSRVIPQDTFLSYSDLIQHSMELCQDIANIGITGVIGVSRSGVIPATLISMQLHVPLYLLDIQKQTIVSAGSGFRLSKRPRQQTFLLVDDSYASGSTLTQAMSVIEKHRLTAKKKVIKAVLYGAEAASHSQLDIIQYHYPLPHFFEWNLFNSILMDHVGADFDGILCHDVPDIEITQPQEYETRLKSARALYLPRKGKLAVICSGRLHRWKKLSVQWLKHHGVKFGAIEFLKLTDARQRTGEAIIEHKCRTILRYRLRMFIESDPRQAEIIAVRTGVPVVCPAARKVYGLQQSRSDICRLACPS